MAIQGTTKETTRGANPGNYCIARIDDPEANAAHAPRWAVNVKRQGVSFARIFCDSMYGGKHSSLLVAQAYRDALMRLLPPYTRRELSVRKRANNTSGTTGVSAVRAQGKGRTRGRIQAWRAILVIDGEMHYRYFSIREHGAQAKQLAIAARQEMLAQCPSRFATIDTRATQIAETAFPELLQPSVQTETGANMDDQTTVADAAVARGRWDKAALQERRDQLNAWFDALRPQMVCVRVSVYQIARRGHTYEGLFVTVGDGESSSKRAREVKSKDSKSWMLKRRPYEKALRLAWPYIQDKVTERFGVHCWSEFENLYRAAIFTSTPDRALYIRHRYDQPGGEALRSTPPASLAPLLADFRIPQLLPQEQAVLVS